MDVEEAIAILRVKRGQPFAEVTARWKVLVRNWHPDQHPAESPRYREAEAEMKSINAAYALIEELVQGGEWGSESAEVPDSSEFAQPPHGYAVDHLELAETYYAKFDSLIVGCERVSSSWDTGWGNREHIDLVSRINEWCPFQIERIDRELREAQKARIDSSETASIEFLKSMAQARLALIRALNWRTLHVERRSVDFSSLKFEDRLTGTTNGTLVMDEDERGNREWFRVNYDRTKAMDSALREIRIAITKTLEVVKLSSCLPSLHSSVVIWLSELAHHLDQYDLHKRILESEMRSGDKESASAAYLKLKEGAGSAYLPLFEVLKLDSSRLANEPFRVTRVVLAIAAVIVFAYGASLGLQTSAAQEFWGFFVWLALGLLATVSLSESVGLGEHRKKVKEARSRIDSLNPEIAALSSAIVTAFQLPPQSEGHESPKPALGVATSCGYCQEQLSLIESRLKFGSHVKCLASNNDPRIFLVMAGGLLIIFIVAVLGGLIARLIF